MLNISFIDLSFDKMAAEIISPLFLQGYNVKFYNNSKKTKLKISGITYCKTLQEAITNTDIIFTNLENSPNLLKLLQENTTIAKETLIIDFSQESQTISSPANQNILKYIDCVISHNLNQENLIFILGGEKSNVEKVKLLLNQTKAKVFHSGGIGSPKIAKLCNDLLLSVNMVAVAEAFNLGIKSGLDPKLLTEIINISSGKTWCLENYHPIPGILKGDNVPSNNNYKNGISVKKITETLKNGEMEAVKLDCPLPMTNTALQLYKILLNQEFKGKDFSVIYQFLKDKSF